MVLWCRQLVKKCKFFLKKVWEKFGFKGKMVVPLQPQTGNGGSRRGKKSGEGFAEREKVVTFARPAPSENGAVRGRTLK